jgi:hypothetical protein
MFVGNQDSVDVLDVFAYRRQPRQRFPFAESRIHQQSGLLRLEQRDVPRAARRQNRDPQTDRFPLSPCPFDTASAHRAQLTVKTLTAPNFPHHRIAIPGRQ